MQPLEEFEFPFPYPYVERGVYRLHPHVPVCFEPWCMASPVEETEIKRVQTRIERQAERPRRAFQAHTEGRLDFERLQQEESAYYDRIPKPRMKDPRKWIRRPKRNPHTMLSRAHALVDALRKAEEAPARRKERKVRIAGWTENVRRWVSENPNAPRIGTPLDAQVFERRISDNLGLFYPSPEHLRDPYLTFTHLMRGYYIGEEIAQALGEFCDYLSCFSRDVGTCESIPAVFRAGGRENYRELGFVDTYHQLGGLPDSHWSIEALTICTVLHLPIPSSWSPDQICDTIGATPEVRGVLVDLYRDVPSPVAEDWRTAALKVLVLLLLNLYQIRRYRAYEIHSGQPEVLVKVSQGFHYHDKWKDLISNLESWESRQEVYEMAQLWQVLQMIRLTINQTLNGVPGVRKVREAWTDLDAAARKHLDLAETLPRAASEAPTPASSVKSARKKTKPGSV